ncbi:hypothetical protein BKA56DRAFT_647807 [Ilyonectria sp. MPI-CAGE-AT-0026]|nr:hypothetical protein BKA56DRAFT_647807 [Ilyonectria sp. MPI-CAGE-AT-0026]
MPTELLFLTQQSRPACTELAVELGAALHYPGTDNITWWDARQQAVQPACRVEPSSPVDVSRIMAILVENECRFSVKCGGHSRSPDDSNSVGGVTIDLRRLNTVTLSANNTSATIGGGANTYQVYSALERFNLSFVGGRVDTVGMGGFTLGGGTSPISSKYGWALDNIFEYEVVLANSSIVTASEHRNPDLYWALRGGGNNFGVVTSFLARVFPLGFVYGGSWTFSDDYTDEMLEESQRLFTLVDDPDMTYWYAYSYNQLQDRFTTYATGRYVEPISNPPVFGGLSRIPSESSSGVINSLGNFSVRGPITGTVRHLFTTITYYPSLALSRKGIELFKDEMQSVKNVSGLSAFLIVYPTQTNVLRAMKERGGNSLGIDEDAPLILTLISLGWSDAADDVAMNVSDRVVGGMKTAALELGVYHPYIYLNYAKSDQDVFSGYGERNRRRLIEIQKSVDPNGVFTSKGLWRGYFKLV